MKELSPGEYRTALSVLAFPSETERTRIALSGLPSSTYNLARKRIYLEGWIHDRWVPSPGAFGCPVVELDLARPSPADLPRLERTWQGDPECTLLWVGVQSALGIFYRRSGARAGEGGSPAPDAPSARSVRVSARAGALPVFFDYSGLWARFGGYRVPRSYPRGLPVRSEKVAGRDLSSARTLLGRPPTGPEELPWVNLLRLPRGQRRAVEQGVVQLRSVLEWRALPAFQGRRIGEVVLISGRRRSVPEPAEASRGGLLGALNHDCGVYPFLFAEDPDQVLVGGVGLTQAGLPGRVPVATARRSVMRTLEEHLTDLEITLEPVEGLRELFGLRPTFPSL